MLAFADGEDRRQAVARVAASDFPGTLRKMIAVVEVEIADHRAIGDDRLRERDLRGLADQRRVRSAAMLSRHVTTDRAGLRVEGTDRAGERVDEETLHLVRHVGGNVL